jgi:hypothetical protein
VPYFTACDDRQFGIQPAVLASMVAKLLDLTAPRDEMLLLIRPHPRTTPEGLAAMRDACEGSPSVMFDAARSADNVSLLQARTSSMHSGPEQVVCTNN